EKYCRQQELSQIARIKKELTNRSTLIKFSLTFGVHYKIVGRFFFKNLITLLSEKALSITILNCTAFPIRNTNKIKQE
ncbi:hypothetical protein, partial [Aerococcus viridans]|uniref:hypothetical protein n=1 Tax=Aerococcus viridans TaxID=1377 RepID=UPI0030C7094E